jgi:sulfur carrier protein
MDAVAITVNGAERHVPPGSGLLELLAELGLDPRAVAVEHNGEIVRRARLGEATLQAGDRVEIVRFVQGGQGELAAVARGGAATKRFRASAMAPGCHAGLLCLHLRRFVGR